MKNIKILFLIVITASAFSMAKETSNTASDLPALKRSSRSGEFTCGFLNGTDGSGCIESTQVQQALTQTCDLTKPFSTSIGDGATCYEQMLLYCCTAK